MEAYQDFLLLVDGKEAFPSILSAIDNAKKNIHIKIDFALMQKVKF